MIRIWRWLHYAGFVMWEVVKGTTADVLATFKPPSQQYPAIVEVPLRCTTDLEIALYAWSITIPPSTAVIAIAAGDEERPATMFVHLMHRRNLDEIMHELRDLETRLLRCTRKDVE